MYPQRVFGDELTDELQVTRMALEQPFHGLLSRTNPTRLERPSTDMRDVNIIAEHVLQSGLSGTHRKIVLLAITESESFLVKQTEPVYGVSGDRHAKAHCRVDFGIVSIDIFSDQLADLVQIAGNGIRLAKRRL